jgi:hypothetical protein
MVHDENMLAFQTAIIVIKELMFYTGKLWEDNTIGRGGVGVGVVAM